MKTLPKRIRSAYANHSSRCTNASQQSRVDRIEHERCNERVRSFFHSISFVSPTQYREENLLLEACFVSA